MDPARSVSDQQIPPSPPTKPVLSGIATPAVRSPLPWSTSTRRGVATAGQAPPSLSTSPVIPASPNITVAAPINQQSAISNQQSPSTGHPEVKAGPVVSPEAAEIEVIPESPEISPELAEHVERVVHGEVQLPGPIDVGVHEGQQVTISPAAPQQPNIVLPITQADFVTGQKQPVASSWKWLYEFVKRIILMMPGRTMYRES